MKKISVLLGILGLTIVSLASCSPTPDTRITVSFDWNYASEYETPESIKLNPGDKYGELPVANFEREGYTFDGWSVRSDGKGELIDSDTIVPEDAEDHTLYAIWAGKTYTVNFELNGGNINGVTSLSPKKVTFGKMYGAMVIPNNPVKKLGSFLGWYLNPEGTGSPITYSTLVKTASDHTIYAVYKNVRLHYSFENEDELEDFFDVYDALSLNIVDNHLEIVNVSDDPRAYLELECSLKSGSSVLIDAEFDGVADAFEDVKASFYTYGSVGDGQIMASGQLGDPNSSKTRDEIKQWYWGQGANNIESWEREEWNEGHIHLHMNILEDCSGIVFMLEFGRRRIDEMDFDPDKTLWENNKWIINSIDINYADHELVKDEYDFTEAGDADSFTYASNVSYFINNNALKVMKGEEEGDSYLELETQYLPKGSKVNFDISFQGEVPYYDADDKLNTLIGFHTYGAYPNGMRLQRKVDNKIVTSNDPLITRDWYWGGYGATNEKWSPIQIVDNNVFRITTYVFEDCYGISMLFRFANSSENYFLIHNIEIIKPNRIYNEYDFEKEDQINDFANVENSLITIDEDDDGAFLKIENAEPGHAHFALKKPLPGGSVVRIEFAYVTDNPVYKENGQFTWLIGKANYACKLVDDATVLGNASWDGGWDGSKTTMELEIDDDCYGVNFELVFNDDVNAYFKITSITF